MAESTHSLPNLTYVNGIQISQGPAIPALQALSLSLAQLQCLGNLRREQEHQAWVETGCRQVPLRLAHKALARRHSLSNHHL